VLIATDEQQLAAGKADVWDSGKVQSSEGINVRYGGRDLQAREHGYWTVRVWDRDDRPSELAAPAVWEIAPWDEEVEGDWIGRPKRSAESEQEIERGVTYFRRAFTLPPGFTRATLHATAFGLYEMSVNGLRADDYVLSPGYTDYPKRVLSQSRDVTSLVRAGENVLGAILSGGWCTARLGGAPMLCGSDLPRLRAALEVTLADGSRQSIESDAHWKYSSGPLLSAGLFEGESYDARRELTGWDAPGFDDGAWSEAIEYDVGVERNVPPDPGVPLRVSEDLPAAGPTEPAPGRFVFDLGRNIVGWARLSIDVPAGTEITLRYARELRPDGSLALAANAKPVVDRYVARGGGSESWEPRFSLRDFRYVELRGLPVRPVAGAVSGRVVHSEMPPTGTLQSSSADINRLFARIDGAQKRAFVSVPSFGLRAETQGALLDAHASALTACLNRDVQRFYRKWIDDIRDAQLPSSGYTERAPAASSKGGVAGVGGVLVPWALYRCYADHTLLGTHLTSMGLFLDFVRTKNPDLIWRHELGAELGDPGEAGGATDSTLIATAELAYAASALAQIARDGGASLEPTAERYQKLADGTRAAFVREFVQPDGRLKSDTQSAYAVAIARGLLDDSAREQAGKHLVLAIERANGKPTTGRLGSALLLPALSLVGRDDIAYALLPHFAATGSPPPALGEWLYSAVGGIELDPAAPAGRRVLVRPRPGGGVTSAQATFSSLYGPIKTDWKLDAKKFRLGLELPVGSGARVALPLRGVLTESGAPAATRDGVQVVTLDDQRQLLELGSGRYDIAVEAP
jgi:alpha-L-rhamnosidase